MWVSVDLCLVPIAGEVSLSPYVAACQEVIQNKGLIYELGPNGTAIEGEWNDVFECVKECHQAVHDLGVIRIFTSLKVNTRSDRKQSFGEKVKSVMELMTSKKLG